MEYYFKSDFSIVETFTDSTGVPIDLNDFDFEIVYQTTGVDNYKAFKKGEVLINCSIDTVDSSKLIVVFQNHKLSCGQLHREIKIKVLNPLFKDYQLVVTHPFTEITLVQNGGDQTTGYASAGIPVVIPFTPSVITDIADADSFLGISALGVFFKTTWLNIKAKLKAYFDTIYASITHNHNLNDLAEKSYNSLDDLPILDFEPANENIQSHIGDGDIHVTSTEKSTWSGKQDALTFSTDIETDKASTTKVSAIKTFYDWAVAKFLLATKLVTSWAATPSNDNIPSEKLVKDSLDLKADIAPANGSTSALRALFIARGYDRGTYHCVYNETSGYYEMNGITDLTESEMVDIFAKSIGLVNMNMRAVAANVKCRTLYPLFAFPNTKLTLAYLNIGSSFMSHFRCDENNYITEVIGTFSNCINLIDVQTLRILYMTNATAALNCFNNCPKLVTAYIKSIKVSFSFAWSPLLSLASLQYLVTNRANDTTRITITVHATVWGYLNDAVNYPTWNALLVDAVANQYIDFASA